ncbi:hypothetical protein BHC47_04985 [Snodgrassella alvi]|uniref:Prepilin-type N-terminal cleavage/methylation domain-containing protein n=1 Tax=Snodgrassella alvi TaxID=1196083 RepID=A0A2N9Y481_9NEIS|nr:prepilin-type N-terminal cleavage/methylation domain-containing protein [Snodgrassella alvi]PIT62448.1 hypothetical protein BHC47_04985 [Snodgrassella alvi]PIT62731.1 hypothetical protein BHC56_00630 [Snodgrassella alvi]
MQFTYTPKSNAHIQKGFTLIELMVVIAIIGFLAAIAIFSYQNNVTKTQLTRAYYELKASTTAINTIIALGNVPTMNRSLDGQPVNGTTKIYEFTGIDTNNIGSDIMSSIEIISEQDRVTGLRAELGNHVATAINGTIITLERSDGGSWTCYINPHGNSASNLSRYAINDCNIIQN